GILRSVVEAFVLPVLHAGHDLPLGRGIAAQLVGDQHTRRSPLLLQELAEQAFGGLLVAPALDEDIENEALLVDRAPEPVLLAGDGDHDLIKVPLVAAAGRSSTDTVGEFPAEFPAPLPEKLPLLSDGQRGRSRGRTGDPSRARTFDSHGHGIAYRPRGPWRRSGRSSLRTGKPSTWRRAAGASMAKAGR